MSYELPEGYVLARIKPYNPKRGYLLKSYTWQGTRYREADGWYAVDPATAAHLRSVNSRVGDPDSPKAFDVCSPSEAESLEETQKLAEQAKAPAAAPKIVTAKKARKLGTKPAPEEDIPPPLARLTEEEEEAAYSQYDDADDEPAKPKQTTRRVRRKKN